MEKRTRAAGPCRSRRHTPTATAQAKGSPHRTSAASHSKAETKTPELGERWKQEEQLVLQLSDLAEHNGRTIQDAALWLHLQAARYVTV